MNKFVNIVKKPAVWIVGAIVCAVGIVIAVLVSAKKKITD